MKTTKTSSFQGNLHLMPNRVYFKESSHQVWRTLLYFIFWVVPLKAIQQTMSLVIKGSPAQLKQTTKPHTDIEQNQKCSLTSSVEEIRNV